MEAPAAQKNGQNDDQNLYARAAEHDPMSAPFPIKTIRTETIAEHAAAEAIVAFEAVSKTFAGGRRGEDVTALSDISLTVPQGSITAIIGRSGAGKSTLIRLVNGLEKPSGGRVVVNGTDVAPLSEDKLRGLRRSIGMIFQHFNLLSSRTVFDNVALPLEIVGLSRKEIEARVAPLLELVGLSDKRERYPSEISGGQKQRVGIARALATRPKLLLSDEATSALDPETTQAVLDLLRRINTELGLTILLITHEMEVVKRVADQVAVIDGGRIVEHGTTFEVFSSPGHATTRALLSGLPGYRLPAIISERVKTDAGRFALLRIAAQASDEGLPPVPASAGHSIVAGFVDTIGGRAFASFILQVPTEGDGLQRATQALTFQGFRHEVIGYVD